MSAKLRNALLAGFGTAMLCTLLAWAGGYDFDTRNFLVGYGLFCALAVSAFAAQTAWSETEGDK